MRMIAELLQKAQKVKENIDGARARLAGRRVSAEAGNGAVTVTASGDKQLVSIEVDHERARLSGRPVEALILEASNEALTKAEALVKEELNGAFSSAGLGLPGLF